MSYKAIYEQYYKKAQEERSWFTLTPYPYLLFRWQIENPKDVHAIAKLASHRTGKHKWCGDECDKIEAFIQKYELGQKSLMVPDARTSAPEPTGNGKP